MGGAESEEINVDVEKGGLIDIDGQESDILVGE